MYFSAPPPLADGAPALRVARWHRRAFDPPPQRAVEAAVLRHGVPDPQRSGVHLLRYTGDLAGPWGLAVREDVLGRTHPSYSAMSLEMLAAVVEPGAEPLDLILIAHALPEVDGRRCISSHLNEAAPGDPLAFAISDVGSSAPFAALDVARGHASTGTGGRVLLLVLEQAELPYEAPDWLPPGRHTAVAMLLAPDGPARLAAVRQRPGVGAEDLADALKAELAALPPGPGEVTVVAAEPVAAAAAQAGWPGDAVRPPAGLHCTASWWALIGELDPSPGAARRLVVIDHDATISYLCLAVFDIDP